MSELPKGWLAVALSDVADVIRGVTYKKEQAADEPKDSFLPVLRATNITGFSLTFDALVYVPEHDISADQLLRRGDVVIASSSGSKEIVGKSGALKDANFVGSFGAFCTGIRPSRGISLEYFEYYFQTPSYRKSVSELSAGSNINNLKSGDLAAQRFPLPPSAEQTRIVAKLEELLSDLDAGVAELKAAQTKLGQYRQSLLKVAVEGALTAEWRAKNTPTETGSQLLQRILTERRARWEAKQLAKFKEQGKTPPKDWQKKYHEPVQPNTTDLPELPDGWVWASVDQCSLDELAITDGPFGSNLKSSHYQDSGPRVIRLQNIGDGVFIDAKAHISKEHYEQLKKHAVEQSDLVVAMLGEVLPRACTIPAGVAPAIVKADCARIRLNPDLAIAGVVASQLNSKPIRDVALKFIKGIGRPRINLGHIRSIPVAICSMEEQRAIDSALLDAESSIEDQMKAIDLSLKQSTAQRQNILRAAFAGELVPQDPSDEPASALLERICAERAERAKQPKTRKTKPKEIATVLSQLIDVLAEAGDWVPAQEAFHRCGVVDGTLTERIEELYAELRKLDKAGRLAVEAVTDAQGRKLYDKLKLLAG